MFVRFIKEPIILNTFGIVKAYFKQLSCNSGKQNSKISLTGRGLLEPCLEVEGMEFSRTDIRNALS